MKKMVKIAAVITVAGMLGAAGAAYAAAAKTPAEIASAVTGKTVDELNQERAAGKTYGTIADEAGKLEEFKAQMLEQRKEILDLRVQEGKLTQEQADEMYNAMKDNQISCDSTGNAAMKGMYGAGFGQGSGMGDGQGAGRGKGMRNGGGMGAGRGMNR